MKKLGKSLSIFLICALLISILAITVSAGQAINTIDSRTYAETLQTATWHNSNADITVENGNIVFPRSSTSDTKLICKEVVEKSSIYNDLLTADATLTFRTLPAGESFSLGFSLDSIEASTGDSGNVEIEFANKGGIIASVKIYDDDGNAKTVVSKNVGSLNSAIRLSAKLTVDDKLSVTVNGVSLCSNYNTNVDVSGRVGFMQTGGCGLTASNVLIKIYNYSLPENTNIDEDFNDGEWNKNVFGSGLNFSAAHPAGIYIGEYNGQGALIIENSLVGWVATKQQYSNFEMQYDVLYTQNFIKYNDDGSTYSGKTQLHRIRFGSEYWEVQGWGGDNTGNSLQIGANSGMIYSNGTESTYGFSPDHKIDIEENSKRPYTVKIRMVDGVFTAWLKWQNERDFVELIHVDNSSAPTPTGHIQLIFDSGVNMVIDNLKITNLDIKPNLADIEYLSNRLPEIHHAEYVQAPIKYRDPSDDVDSGFNYYIITLIGAAACVVFIGVTLVILAVLKKKKKKALALAGTDAADAKVAVPDVEEASAAETGEHADE